MGNFNLKADVNFEKALDNIEDAIEDGIRASKHPLAKVAEDAARSKLRQEEAVYNRETIEGFRHQMVQGPDGSAVLRIWNRAEHAPYVDQGVSGTAVKRPTPHQYTTEKPPLPPILAWAERTLGGWQVNAGGTGLVPADD